VESDIFRTNVGLTYFRQVRDGKTSMPSYIANYRDKDTQLLVLFHDIKRLELHIAYPYSDKDCEVSQALSSLANLTGLTKKYRAPFNALPCHREIAIEIQGEKWVLEREEQEERSVGWHQRFTDAERKARKEAEQKKREAKIRFLRDL